MAAQLSITLDEELYQRLKRELPPKRISRFIEEAVRAKLGASKVELDAAYKAASKEPWRSRLATDWSATEDESWPE
jgi:hypothetical protein